MWSTLQSLDEMGFVFINQSLANPVLDWLLPWLTDAHKTPWILLLALILGLALYRQGGWKGLGFLLASLILVAFADWLGSQVIKEYFQRPRPVLAGLLVVERVPRHSGYSFLSNHATNTWAFCVFVSMYLKSWRFFLFPLAFLIALSRVYVGVHYPSDVILGSLWGSVMALAWFRLLQKKFHFL